MRSDDGRCALAWPPFHLSYPRADCPSGHRQACWVRTSLLPPLPFRRRRPPRIPPPSHPVPNYLLPSSCSAAATPTGSLTSSFPLRALPSLAPRPPFPVLLIPPHPPSSVLIPSSAPSSPFLLANLRSHRPACVRPSVKPDSDWPGDGRRRAT
ncbi:hypothetical protein DFH09DRAFT_1162618 [Mycena vulgaris]|nr:hypothetical protein DFH09DRAFT_1162618 [Mycena vulgaris]